MLLVVVMAIDVSDVVSISMIIGETGNFYDIKKLAIVCDGDSGVKIVISDCGPIGYRFYHGDGSESFRK